MLTIYKTFKTIFKSTIHSLGRINRTMPFSTLTESPFVGADET